MNNQLTDKTYVVVAAGIGRLFVTEKEALDIERFIEQKTPTVKIGKSLVRTASIHGVVPASEIENLDRVKRGDYQCQYGTWHSKGITCNCAEAKRLGLM